MPIRITGLNSGLDTEALVSELVSAYRTKSQKYVKAQTKLSWTQDAWKSLNSKISTFYSKLTSLKFSTGYSTKKATVSDSTKATVSASSGAVNGTYTLKVNNTAKAGYLTGAELSSNITESSTMSALGFTDQGTISLTVEGKTKYINVNGNTTISDFVNSLNDAGVNASYDSKYHRIYVSAKNSGVENDFTLAGMNSAGNDALTKLGLNVDSAITETYQKWASYAWNTDGKPYITGYDNDGNPITDGTYDERQTMLNMSAILSQKGVYSAQITNNEAKMDYAEKWLANNTTEADMRNAGLDQDDIDEIKAISSQSDLDTYTARLNSENNVAKQYIEDNKLIDTTTSTINTLAERVLGATEALNGTSTANIGAVRIAGEDAVIELNGAVYKSSSNNFDINGLSITAMAKTDGEISITVDTDSQALYDRVKDFITEYNTLINEMTSLYNAESAKGYEPLTTEEKDAMSETEIAEWEKKIKDSLLRRDDTLSSIMSSMTNIMLSSYTVNGKSYSLSSFGISTLGILNAATNEENAFHIDGDADDLNTSANTDKLMAAIREDPDLVVDFLKQLATNLYDTIGSRMSSSTLSSYGVVYNDKQMAQEYSDYTTTISKWEQKLSDLEESYYQKFAAMESALAALQSQQSALSGLFGF